MAVAPNRLNIDVHSGLTGTRILKVLEILGRVDRMLLLVIWR